MCCGNRWFPMCACTSPACPLADRMGASGKIRGHHTGDGWPDLMQTGFWLCPDFLDGQAALQRPAPDGPSMRAPPACPGFRWLEIKMDPEGKRCAECRANPSCRASAGENKKPAAERPAWKP